MQAGVGMITSTNMEEISPSKHVECLSALEGGCQGQGDIAAKHLLALPTSFEKVGETREV